MKLPQNVQANGKAAISSHKATRLKERVLTNVMRVRAVLDMVTVSKAPKLKISPSPDQNWYQQEWAICILVQFNL